MSASRDMQTWSETKKMRFLTHLKKLARDSIAVENF